MPNTIIELTVRNHPGVMSRITGLFSRRAFNLEGIMCSPIGDGTNSRMLLMVRNDARINQVFKDLDNLYDVYAISKRQNRGRELFQNLRDLAPVEKQVAVPA